MSDLEPRSKRAGRGRTQTITAADIASGRVRIPSSDASKLLLPAERGRIPVVFKGVPLGDCAYNPRFGPTKERSGVISIAKARLTTLACEGEVLPLTRNRLGVVYIGDRGSKLRIAEWVNRRPDDLSAALLANSKTLTDFAEERAAQWLSPLKEDAYRELADDLWDRCDLPAPTPTADGFWPSRQPNWDAVATVAGPGKVRGLVLVEAKSHVAEVRSNLKATSRKSRSTIVQALASTKRYVGADDATDWTQPYYQAANRFAFLYLPARAAEHPCVVVLRVLRRRRLRGRRSSAGLPRRCIRLDCRSRPDAHGSWVARLPRAFAVCSRRFLVRRALGECHSEASRKMGIGGAG